VIEDIEGAASEPMRHRHVVVLSGAVATASLVLLFSMVAPPEFVMTREAASPAPSATAGSSMWTVTGPRMFLQTGPSVWAPPGVNVRSVVSVCAEGAQINPPYYLVFEGDGQVMTVPLEARTAPSPLTPSPLLISVDQASRTWADLVSVTASCATPTTRVPRMDRRR